MILGVTIEALYIELGGLTLFALVGFQILVGLRKIKFKGPKHLKIHKWTAYAMLVFALLHGFIGIVFLNSWRILS